MQKSIRHSENLDMENCSIPSEIISALIAVGGSVITFILASLFSVRSRRIDEKHYFHREMLSRRLSYYENLLRWLPVEKLSENVNPQYLGSENLSKIFMQHFSELAEFIVRARLYASDDVVRELLAFQKEYNLILSESLSNKNLNKLPVNGKSCGDIEIDGLLCLCRSYADRIITLISTETSTYFPCTDICKVVEKRDKKSSRTSTENHTNKRN